MPSAKKYLPALLTAIAISCTHADIEEILVTSQKREQSLNTVPFSVTAINAKTLNSQNIRNLNQLHAFVPGLYISSTETSHPTYNIRGLSSGTPSAQSAARIAIYLNDADISRNRSSHIELHDMARIEVVKGPQSTLFGTAASAGAIAYYTQQPSQERYSKLSLSAGNLNLFEVRAVANGGNDTLQARLAFLSRNRDGYIDNNLVNGQELGSIDRLSVRPSFRWNINDVWRADLVLTHENSGDTITPNKSGIISPVNGNTSPFSFAAISGSPVTSVLFPNNSLNIERSTDDANLQFHGNLGDWSVTSLSAYREYDSITPFDADGSQAHAFELLEQASGQQFSQEFRGHYSRNKLSVTTALSYVDEDNQRSNAFSADEGSYLMCVPLARSGFSPLFNQFAQLSPRIAGLAAILDPINGLPCTNADGSVNSLTPFATGGSLQSLPYFAILEDFASNTTRSALVDIGYDISNRLHVDAGLRYVSEHRNSAYRAVSPPAVLLLNLRPLLTVGDTNGQTIRDSSQDDDVLLRINARYQWRNNHYAYASYSEGRRSVVVDVRSTLDASSQPLITTDIIPAEKMENFELGVKGQTTALRYSAALYYQRYHDFQVGFLDAGGIFRVANAGNTNNAGVELSTQWQVNNALLLFSHINVFDRTLDNNASNGIFGGKALENSSEHTATLGFNLSHAVAEKQLSLNVYGHYRSEFATDSTRQPVDPISGLSLTQAGFSVLNGSLTLASPDDWSISLWVNNLSNKEYLSDISDIGANLGMPTYQAAEPRTWGLTFTLTR